MALFALLLSMRVLASTGYMPELDHGRLTLMLCPDGQWTAAAPKMAGMAGDQHQSPAHRHLICPYAAAAATPLAPGASPPIVTASPPSFVPFRNRVPTPLRLGSRIDRPHSTGPPTLA
jgi:hypothetical protein